MDNSVYLSVIIPAYNEGGRKGEELKKNLQEIGEYMRKNSLKYEVIVVNDGSSDNTAEFVKNLSSLVNDNLSVIDRKENRGKWYSVREGFMKASGKFRLLTDADGATSIHNLDRFVIHMEKDADVIIGSRDMKESKIGKHQPRWKELLGDAGNILIQFLMGLRGIEDTQCGFKVLSEKAALDIIDKMRVDRWGGDFEMLMLAKKMDYEIVEVPVIWMDAGKSLVGVSGLGGYMSTLKELFQVKMNLIMGKYNIKKEK